MTRPRVGPLLVSRDRELPAGTSLDDVSSGGCPNCGNRDIYRGTHRIGRAGFGVIDADYASCGECRTYWFVKVPVIP